MGKRVGDSEGERRMEQEFLEKRETLLEELAGDREFMCASVGMLQVCTKVQSKGPNSKLFPLLQEI